jgi:hypothetical protein
LRTLLDIIEALRGKESEAETPAQWRP